MGEHYLEDISFSDIHVCYAGGGTAEQAAKRDIPKVAAEYFGVWATAPGGPPAYGLFARNVKGLRLQNISFTYQEPDVRPAIVFDNVQDATINGLTAKGSADTELVRLINSRDILFSAVKVQHKAASFIQVEGAESEGIIIDGGDLRKATKALVFANQGKEDAVTFRM
jgi:hypothetical protein